MLWEGSWIWTSPFTTDNEGLALIDKVKQMGFDSFEFGLEDPSHVDPARLKERIGRNGLRIVICGAFGPDRDLTHYGSGLWRFAFDRRLGDYGRTVTSAQAASHRGKPVTCPGQFT